MQDRIGSTALQCAITAWRNHTVKLLLMAGADPSIPNYTATTPLHDAAAFGQLAYVYIIYVHVHTHVNYSIQILYIM